MAVNGMLLGWPVIVVALTSVLPIRQVILFSIIGGNLFLPVAGIALPGFPDYTKPLAAGLGAFLASSMIAAPRLLSWRPQIVDSFFLCFLIAPSISSLLNGLGGYDAAAVFVNRFFEWGIAYWVGRSLFNDELAMRELALAVVVGGIIYVPFCLWESVMSPQLHRIVYGYHPSGFSMTRRMGGWRPVVFMRHGLAVGTWMASAAVVAWVLWRSRAVSSLWLVPMMWIAIGLVAVTVSLRSTGAALLLVGMIGAVEFVQMSRIRLALLSLILLPAGYVGSRVAGWEGQQLVEFASIFGEERVGSLTVRLENDTIIVDRAMDRPVFGWGGWGRWRVRDEFGNDITVSDSWWGILVGSTGVFGLVAAYGTFMAPMFLLIRQRSRRRIFEGSKGAAWAVGMAILLFMLDTLVNAMPNTAFMLAAGAIASFVVRKPRRGAVRAAGAGPEGVPVELAADSGAGPPRPRTIDLR